MNMAKSFFAFCVLGAVVIPLLVILAGTPILLAYLGVIPDWLAAFLAFFAILLLYPMWIDIFYAFVEKDDIK